MKQVYNSLTHLPGATNSGICTIQIAPKEWLANPVAIDFNTGTCTVEVMLIPDKEWISLEFTPNSAAYDETPKESKAGPYYEIALSGIINNMNASLQQIIESIKHHEVVVIFHQRNGLKKIIGDTVTGMLRKYSNKIQNTNAGTETPAIELYLQTENLPPYYTA